MYHYILYLNIFFCKFDIDLFCMSLLRLRPRPIFRKEVVGTGCSNRGFGVWLYLFFAWLHSYLPGYIEK